MAGEVSSEEYWVFTSSEDPSHVRWECLLIGRVCRSAMFHPVFGWSLAVDWGRSAASSPQPEGWHGSPIPRAEFLQVWRKAVGYATKQQRWWHHGPLLGAAVPDQERARGDWAVALVPSMGVCREVIGLEQRQERADGVSSARVACIPFGVPGLALGDLVEVVDDDEGVPWVGKVLERGGRAVQVMTCEDDAHCFAKSAELSAAGVLHELGPRRTLFIDVAARTAGR